MMRVLKSIWKRIRIHWISTLRGLLYLVLFYMYYESKITTAEWITATGAILTVNAFFQKDPNKVETKEQFKRPD